MERKEKIIYIKEKTKKIKILKQARIKKVVNNYYFVK